MTNFTYFNIYNVVKLKKKTYFFIFVYFFLMKIVINIDNKKLYYNKILIFSYYFTKENVCNLFKICFLN